MNLKPEDIAIPGQPAKKARALPGLFTVFEGKRVGAGRGKSKRQHYARMTGGGNITWNTEGFDRVASAHAACASCWVQIAKRIDPDHLLQWPPVPYTKDSLRPEVPDAADPDGKIADIA